MNTVEWRDVALGELRSTEDELRIINDGYIFRRNPRNEELLQVTVLPINLPKYRPFDVPDFAVSCRRPPVTKEGKPCNPNGGDFDKWGCECKMIAGIWWRCRWYADKSPFKKDV